MKNLIFIITVFALFSCMEKVSDLPAVKTSAVTEITLTSAISGGIISAERNTEISDRGIFWNTNPKPETGHYKNSEGKGSGAFTSKLTGLIPNTTYYIRAYAVNEAGIGYGDEISFTTSEIEQWMEKSYFALPPLGLALMVDQEATIYGDALINVPIHNNLDVSYECDIGTESGNDFRISPKAGDAGNHTLKITFKNNGYQITTGSIRFTVYDAARGESKKILLIGDSTLPPDIQPDVIRNVLGNSTITFVGTVGMEYKNEAYGGASWSSYISGRHGKFTKSGVLDIPAYFADNSINTPDYIYIRLGINDTFKFCEEGSGPISDQNINIIISSARTLIDAFLDFDENIKIVLGIPTLSENSGEGWAIDYGPGADQDLFIEQMHRYWQTFITTFANGEYNSRVDCSYDAIFLDRDNGYPKINNIHNSGVHPCDEGFEQLGKGMAMAFNKLMNAD